MDDSGVDNSVSVLESILDEYAYLKGRVRIIHHEAKDAVNETGQLIVSIKDMSSFLMQKGLVADFIQQSAYRYKAIVLKEILLYGDHTKLRLNK